MISGEGIEAELAGAGDADQDERGAMLFRHGGSPAARTHDSSSVAARRVHRNRANSNDAPYMPDSNCLRSEIAGIDDGALQQKFFKPLNQNRKMTSFIIEWE